MNRIFKSMLLARASLLFLMCMFVPPSLLFATAPSEMEAVSLQKVLEEIIKTDPAIQEALRQYQSVVAERSIATSGYYPTIGTELSAGPERTDGVPTNDIEENFVAANATLYARQNLYSGGKTKAFVGETDARINAAAYEVLTVANRVFLDTSETYINVVRASELLKISEKNVLTQERIMKQVREKTEAGFNRISELYNSESRLALAKGSYISRQQDLYQAVVAFHRQFGRLLNPKQFILPQPSYQIPDTLPETVDIAFKTHPALKVAHYNIEKTQFTYDKASAAYLPTLDLELQGQYRSDTGGEEGDTTQAGAYLTLNYIFYDGGVRAGETGRDFQNIRKEHQRAYIERRNVNETVRLAWNIMEAEESKSPFLNQHVSLSAKTLNAFKDEYFVGRRTLLDLLNMENEYTDAQLSMSDSEFAHLIAVYRLMQATGVLLEEHKTGLHEMVNLPSEENYDETITYEDGEDNRDQDELADNFDQCDNSLPGTIGELYGCKENNLNKTGYPLENSSDFAPYITPKSSGSDAGQP